MRGERKKGYGAGCRKERSSWRCAARREQTPAAIAWSREGASERGASLRRRSGRLRSTTRVEREREGYSVLRDELGVVHGVEILVDELEDSMLKFVY